MQSTARDPIDDLRSPLASIFEHTDLLLERLPAGRLGGAERRWLETIRTAAEHMERLVGDLGDPLGPDAEIRGMLERLDAEQRQLERMLTGVEERHVERLMVKVDGRMIFVRAREVDWVEAEGNYVRLHVGKESYLVRETMSALEAKLDPRHFARVHRSTIVNLDQVRELRPWFAGDYLIALKDGTELRLSRGYRARLEERLG